MLHRITAASARPDFTIEIVFEQNECAIIDFSAFVATGEVTEPLRNDPGFFVSALMVIDDGDAIGWPGGLEIDADALWYKVAS